MMMELGCGQNHEVFTSPCFCTFSRYVVRAIGSYARVLNLCLMHVIVRDHDQSHAQDMGHFESSGSYIYDNPIF